MIAAAQALFLVLALAGCATGRVRALIPLCYAGAAIACLLMLATAVPVLLATTPETAVLRTSLPVGLPELRANLRLDGLSAAFIVIVDVAALFACCFGAGYDRDHADPPRILAPFPAFLLGMNLAMLADDAYVFLVGWEFMSLSSWLLVLASDEDGEARRAGLVYLLMASLGGLSLLMCFGVLAGSGGGYTFDAMRGANLSPALASLAFLALLVGAGSKAGLAPLHLWLPLAHPAAPSHVSALMSGAMTKVAIYALVRLLFDVLGTPLWWWGGLLALLGAVTAALGALQALTRDDTKVTLAYSTIENIGVISAALGLAVAFRAAGLGVQATMALMAAMFHAVNHMLFKSLLFMAAGAVLHATGSRDMARLGGLVHLMRLTAPITLVGCLAASALPPLNGFASEWLIFQATIEALELPRWELKFLVPVVATLLALAAALAAAGYVRFFGTVFLGRSRDPAAGRAHDPGFAMLAPLAALAALCVAIGAVPSVVVEPLAQVAAWLSGAPGQVERSAGGVGPFPTLALRTLEEPLAIYSGIVALLALVALAGVIVGLVGALSPRPSRRGPAWDCGFPDPTPATQYTPSSFAQPLRRIFGTHILAARDGVTMPPAGATSPATFTPRLVDPAWRWAADPLIGAVRAIADRLNRTQFLPIRMYLAFMFATLLTLLSIVAVSR
ncbi:MAG: hydrogenase 4 subunit B [Alphaproteobacteria bacterium]|nr:hydrogenase 4 subunit B [Alphaproteobacteria bacterium]MCW5742086.1 hydrogenase 4 subunit B [Alphaproteobacteria bacterium]